MADFTVEGTILKIERKDGTSDKGDWTQYSFQVQHHDTGEKHFYSTFSTDGADVKTNKSYKFLYSIAENKRKPEYPFRNIQGHMEEIEEPTSPPPAQSSNGGSRGDYQRSKEEMRWTEAMHMAVNLVGSEGATVESIQPDTLRAWIDWFYRELLAAPGVPTNPNNTSKPSERAKEQPSGDTISPEDAASLMNLAETLMGDGGRKWVMDQIKERWNLTDPQKLTDDQAQTIATLLDGGEDGDAVDRLKAEMDEGG